MPTNNLTRCLCPIQTSRDCPSDGSPHRLGCLPVPTTGVCDTAPSREHMRNMMVAARYGEEGAMRQSIGGWGAVPPPPLFRPRFAERG